MACHKLSWFLCVIFLPYLYADEFAHDETDSDELKTLLSSLLDYTGLSSLTPNHTIRNILCDGLETLTECTVNPNGTIVWDVRFEMYSQNMYDYENSTATFDGCQTKAPGNSSQEEYTKCMKEVRVNMANYLSENFETRFKEILQNNCSSLASDNCVNLN